MEIDLLGVYLLEYNSIEDLEIKKMSLTNDLLSSFSKEIKVPSFKRLPSVNTRDKSIFSTSTRFKVDKLEESDYLYFLKLLYDKIETFDESIDWLDSVDNLFDKNNKFKPNLIVYKLNQKYSVGEVTECLYIHELKESMAIRNKTLIFGKVQRKDKESGASEFDFLTKTEFLALPDEGFICSVEKNDKTVSAKVFKAFELDTVFKVESLIDGYAEKKIYRFIHDGNGKKFKLTQDKSEVSFRDEKGNDVTAHVVRAITESENLQLKKSYASFSGRPTKTIQKISLQRLKEVVESLILYATENKEKCLFKIEEIPRIDVLNNKVFVDQNSVKIFAAMLNNEIIQKLLDEKIEIPYYQEVA